MSDTRSLYEQVILDHNKRPRNYGSIANADRVVEGHNPLCGDSFTIYLKYDGNTIADAHFEGDGCAISKSSASLMTTLIKGSTKEEAKALADAFQHMLKSDMNAPVNDELLGKMRVFAGVREFPMRIKCATLAWHALKAGLSETPKHDQQLTVSTE